MAADMDVFVVRNERTGLWDAACCNQTCGHGLHEVSDDNETQAAAEKAAAAHRTHIRREAAEKTAMVKQAEQGSALYWADVARQRRREIARLERDLETTRGGIADFRRFLDDDFRQWCSPDGVAATYAARLIEIFDRAVSEHVSADGEQTGDGDDSEVPG